MQQHALLETKLYIPPGRPGLVSRPRLLERLNEACPAREAFARALTLVSAPAGFGKTTLVSEWVQAMGGSTPHATVAWLSLDEGDNDLARFLAYVIAALGTLRQGTEDAIGQGLLSVLQSPEPPPAEAVLTSLINEVAALPAPMVLVLDDFHLLDTPGIDKSLAFLIEHLPPQMHLVLVTREDPRLPVARWRARGQLTELRAADLRFSYAEAAEFLNQVMGLNLSSEDVTALERRTEGWIAGLQLAALSMQGRKDRSSLVRSFTGSHRYVLDYLVEEVLEQQPEQIQRFLLQTAILERLTAPLCEAVRFGGAEPPGSSLGTAVLPGGGEPPGSSSGTAGLPGAAGPNGGQGDSQAILEMLDRANLFLVPLDGERRWYRYHQLFADLLRQRLHQSAAPWAGEGGGVAGLHLRASVWYEQNGLEVEAFQHAAAANDVERAERLMEGDGGTPLPFRGVVSPVLQWLASLPREVLDAKPSLWVTWASASLFAGGSSGVEEKLQAAEAALEGAEPDGETRDLVGRIASTRANMAVGHRQLDTIVEQSRRALEYLDPGNLTYRTATTWKLGVAYELQGDRAAAREAFTEAIAASQASGNLYTQVLATTGLANIQLASNRLHEAAETYWHVLKLVGDLPIPVGLYVHLCLARIAYEWNDLAAAQHHGEKSLQLAEPYREQYDASVASEVFLARLKLAQGELGDATALLAQAEQSVRRHSFVHQAPAVADAQILVLLRRGNLAAAADLAKKHGLGRGQARVSLAQGDPSAALAALEPLRREAEAKGWVDEQLRVLVLQAAALYALDQEEDAVRTLGEALALAEPGGFVRTFVDEGPPMAGLLYEAAGQGIAPEYVRRLLAAVPDAEPVEAAPSPPQSPAFDLIEPLSEREIEILQLIADGLTNGEIASRLFLSMNTVKAHARNIYGKLGVHSRTQAVARAKGLGILPSA